MQIKVLLIGDIVGKPGRSVVKELLGNFVRDCFGAPKAHHEKKGTVLVVLTWIHLV